MIQTYARYGAAEEVRRFEEGYFGGIVGAAENGRDAEEGNMIRLKELCLIAKRVNFRDGFPIIFSQSSTDGPF